MDLFSELEKKINELNISLKKLRETGTEYAEAERDYKITLRQEALKLRNSLEKVGGDAYLSSLVDMVPTTSNIDSYVKIVEEKATLRALIKAANDVISYGYAETEYILTKFLLLLGKL